MKKTMDWNEIKEYIAGSPKVRREFARNSHLGFFYIYLSSYRTHETANFQREIFDISEDDSIERAVITAFRGSAKSTIISHSYVLWSLVTSRKHHIVILSQTQQLSKLILLNIRKELEENELLIRDFGPFRAVTDEWRQNSLIIPSYNCRITCISCG